MNIRAAIDETMSRLNSGEWGRNNDICWREYVLHVDHLHDMHLRMKRDPDMAEGKLNRWLGWMQAIVVVFTDATLEDMKDINRKHGA